MSELGAGTHPRICHSPVAVGQRGRLQSHPCGKPSVSTGSASGIAACPTCWAAAPLMLVRLLGRVGDSHGTGAAVRTRLGSRCTSSPHNMEWQ
jgi:hypothetical protein